MLKEKAFRHGPEQEENEKLVGFLNCPQTEAYLAARSVGVKAAIAKRGFGRNKYDVVLDGEGLYENSTSAQLSPFGKQKLKQILDATSELKKKALNIRPIYVKSSDTSRSLAKDRAKNLETELGEHFPSVEFSETKTYKELYNNDAFPNNSDRLIVIQPWICLSCRFIPPLLLLLLICLGLHFIEPILNFTRLMFVDEFGDKNFVIDVPAYDPTVEICVRDYGCVDGDKVRLSINSQQVFSGELTGDDTCVSSKVNAGDNTVTMYTINGTGNKGHCPNNVNTGEITIGNQNWEKRQWGLPPDTEKSATLQINYK